METMWVVIHMVRGEEAAQRLRGRLADEGFMVRLRAVYKSLPPEDNTYEIAALKSEAAEARDVLLETGMILTGIE